MIAIPDLSRRTLQLELMDNLGLEENQLQQALRELSRLNSLCFTARQLGREIVRFAREHQLAELSILDIGCGDGATLRKIARYCSRRGLTVKGTGIDFNPRSIDRARRSTGTLDLSFECRDVLKEALPGEHTVIISTLFFHHFNEAAAKHILDKMITAQPKLILIQDLKRSKLGYALAKAATTLFCRSRVVRTDGPWSVEAAYQPEEFLSLVEQCGLSGADLQHSFPERFTIYWAQEYGRSKRSVAGRDSELERGKEAVARNL